MDVSKEKLLEVLSVSNSLTKRKRRKRRRK